MGIKCPKCGAENPDTLKFCGECGTKLDLDSGPTLTAETPKEELTRGTTFASRYEIIEELGKGGMGKVYRVEDTKLNQEVALKLIKPEIAKNKKAIQRFRNELTLARNIRHKNVCGMFDWGEVKGAHFITMEYVHGEDLKSFIRRAAPLSTARTISIAKQICEGLAEAHKLGVIHRDLKSNNLMIDKEGSVRIMDFGIARLVKGKSLTDAGAMIGTPEYMSPEQVEGKEVDQRSDIYSLGIILYEMVTGRVPFEGDTALAIGMKHKSEIPLNPKEYNQQIPDDLSDVILRCLRKNKETRYQSAGELRAELIHIEKGIPTSERTLPKKKPLTSREITVTFGVKKLFIPALIVIAAIIIGIAIWQLLPKKHAVPLPPSDKPSLAILYFENNTGDDKLDHWRKGLSELLITDLSQSKYFRVISGDRIYDILRGMDLLDAQSYSSRELSEVASRGGANYILRGGYTKAADNFRININLQDVKTGESIGSEAVTGQGEGSFYALIDELTKRIKENFKLSAQDIAADIDKQVEKITSSSTEAFTYYSQARKYHLRWEYKEAIKLYEKAVSIDPEFAMAYRGMASAYSNLRNEDKSREFNGKAMELSDRISDRERLQIQGQYYEQSERTYDQAIQAFNELIELYPDDYLGNVYLGLIYERIEEWDKAIERYRIGIETQKDLLSCGNLTDAYKRKGQYDEAIQVWEDYLQTEPDAPQVHLSLGYNYLYQGKFKLAIEEADKAFLLNPRYPDSFYLKGDIYHLMGELSKAEEEYLKILELSGDRSTHLGPKIRLSALYLTRGKIEKGKKESEQVMSLASELNIKFLEATAQTYYSYFIGLKNPEEAVKQAEKALIKLKELDDLVYQRWNLFLKGLYFKRMGSISKIQEISHALKDMIDKGLNKRAIRYHYALEGSIEVENKNFHEAIKYFDRAISLLPYQAGIWDEHVLFMEPLASAYYKSGNLDKAREEYEKISKLTTGRTAYGDIYAKSFFMMGKIYEQQGNTGKAIENYEKFLTLWKDADPGIAEVEDARTRLAGLNSQ